MNGIKRTMGSKEMSYTRFSTLLVFATGSTLKMGSRFDLMRDTEMLERAKGRR